MPCKPRKARLLLRDGKAKAVKREPFTIQLLFGSTGYTQPITVGVDTGAENVGVTVISGKQELNSYEFKLRKDVSQKVQERKMYRRNRRSRLRYRKPRFDNRASSRKKGRLAPGVQEKVDAHCRIINLFQQRLPESTLILETGAFDTQKLQDPSIQGVGY
ncbi:MAG TPA: RNA-guided endonuclease IscB, partial [Chitinophagaceae bacterium]|nr:RNA-guided endonuclease IscB [Chitinophagaceae bacterium]